MTDGPVGPWLVVVGMHRSGTSAVTGALGALGLTLPLAEDRMHWPESNPEHWESLSLALFDEHLLTEMGGCWDGPPDLEPGWEVGRHLEGDPATALAAAYPSAGASVWKDPRLCLLLPYWRSVLPGPIAALLIWRGPVAVAHSLHQRDGMSIASGLALWERYNRSALQALDGIDTFVVNYESVIDNPHQFVESVSDWLASLGPFKEVSTDGDRQGASAVITDELRHQTDRSGPDHAAMVSPEQEDLLKILRKLDGSHRPLHLDSLGVETGWTSGMIEVRRELGQANRTRSDLEEELRAERTQLSETETELATFRQELDHTKSDLDYTKRGLDDTKRGLDDTARALDQTKLALDHAEQKLADVHASTSWRVTKPLRSSVSRIDKLTRRPPTH
jgi:hypothetical protein